MVNGTMTVPPSSKQDIVYLKRENDDEITAEASSEQMTSNEKPAQAEGKPTSTATGITHIEKTPESSASTDKKRR